MISIGVFSLITIYPNGDVSKKKFIENFMQQNIYDNLNTDMSNDPNNNYNVLLDAITKIHERLFTYKKLLNSTKKKHNKDPWITFGILRSVNRKHYLYKRLKKRILRMNILKRGDMFSIPIETI